MYLNYGNINIDAIPFGIHNNLKPSVMKKSIFILVTAALILQSCAKIFYTPDARPLAQNQKIIAIAPPKISIAPRKNVDGYALIEQQKTESVNFQREMYDLQMKQLCHYQYMIQVQTN